MSDHFQIMIFVLQISPVRLSPSRPPPYDGGGEERALTIEGSEE
jgi:hypothetical protein